MFPCGKKHFIKEKEKEVVKYDCLLSIIYWVEANGFFLIKLQRKYLDILYVSLFIHLPFCSTFLAIVDFFF